MESKHSLVRRGLPYIDPEDPSDVGLLFFCAQSSIEEQYEFLQRVANGSNFAPDGVPNPGPDHVIAQPPASKREEGEPRYPKTRFERYSDTIDIDLRMYDFVTLRGAEYLFAPSLSGLRALANGGRR